MDSLEQLNHRIAMLEHWLRRATRLGISGLILASSVLIVGQVMPSAPQSQDKRIINAEEIVVHDSGGSPRVRIGTNGPIAFVNILNRNGDTMVGLSGWGDKFYSGTVTVNAKNGMTGSLDADSGSVGLSLSTGTDKEATENAMREITQEGVKPSVAFERNSDPKRASFMRFSLDERKCEMKMWRDGQPRGSWFVDNKETQLYLADENGRVRGMWDIHDGTTSFQLLDNTMKSRLVLGGEELRHAQSGGIERRSESSILLFGEDSKVIFSAP